MLFGFLKQSLSRQLALHMVAGSSEISAPAGHDTQIQMRLAGKFLLTA